jgi:hypothetical protein
MKPANEGLRYRKRARVGDGEPPRPEDTTTTILRTSWYKAQRIDTGEAATVWVNVETREGMTAGEGETRPLEEVLAEYELIEQTDGHPPGAMSF